ncbi:MAG TPA: ABC transporter ATP-binding protein [Chloroflexota bacterium]
MTTLVEAGMDHAELERTDTYAIDIDGLRVQFGRSIVVRDLSMHVPHGSIYGLVGPSGAGKSITMRVLATLQKADGGRVRVDSIDLTDNPAVVRRRIGYLPDAAGVYEDLTVREYLDFYGALFQVPVRRRRQSTDELLELVGLAQQRSHPVKTLSRSMKQQLGLARCLVHDPSVLLLDEPAAGMDPQARLELRDILRELARFGKTVLICSHMLSELAEVCTHLGFMRAGELIAEGEIDEIMSAVFPESRLRVQLLDGRDGGAARAVLESIPALGPIEAQNDWELLAWYSGSRQNLPAVLGQLRASGLQVAGFALEQRSLDDIFLLLTAARTEE